MQRFYLSLQLAAATLSLFVPSLVAVSVLGQIKICGIRLKLKENVWWC
jgi:hypothetical protein